MILRWITRNGLGNPSGCGLVGPDWPQFRWYGVVAKKWKCVMFFLLDGSIFSILC